MESLKISIYAEFFLVYPMVSIMFSFIFADYNYKLSFMKLCNFNLRAPGLLSPGLPN